MESLITTNELAYRILGVRKEELKALAVDADSYYKPFFLPKSDGGKRLIEPPQDGSYLKTIQKRINKTILKPAIRSLPDNVIGGREGYCVKDNAMIHARSRAFMKFDFKDYFPSIKYEIVFGIFRYDLHFCEESANILALLTTYRRHLPQGAPTSTSIAILASKKMHQQLKELGEQEGFNSSAWIDDLAISSDSESVLEKNEWIINKTVGATPFMQNDRKRTGIIKRGSNKGGERKLLPYVTGVAFDLNGKMRLPDKKRRVKSLIAKAKNPSKSLEGKIRFIASIEPDYGKKLKRRYNENFPKHPYAKCSIY